MSSFTMVWCGIGSMRLGWTPQGQWAATPASILHALSPRDIANCGLFCGRRGIKHNISWSSGTLGIASTRAFPQWLLLMPGCPSPDGGPAARRHERSLGAARGPSLNLDRRSPAEVLLEAACNGSIPSLPGVSNFTLFLYCHLFNGSKEPSQSPLDLEAICSVASWYLSSLEGDSFWSQACKESFPYHFNSTASGHAPLLWCCFLEEGEEEEEEEWWTFRAQNLCGKAGWRELNEGLRQRLSVLFCHPRPNATSHQSSHGGCDPSSTGSPQAPCHASLLGECRGGHRCRLWALVCSCGSLLESLQGVPPWVRLHCLAEKEEEDQEEEGRTCWCCFQRVPGIPSVPIWLCRHAPSFLVKLLSQLVWCTDSLPSSSSSSPHWVPSATGYLLWLLDPLFAVPALEEVGQGIRQPLGQALLLAGLLGNDSSWASFHAHVALQDVSRFLQEGRDAAAKEELLHCFSVPPWEDPVLRLLVVQLLSAFPRLTPQLALHLSHCVPAMTVLDILHLPPALLANNSVLAVISSQSARMTPAQKRALVQQLLQTRRLGDVPSWPLELGSLICFLSLEELRQISALQDLQGPVEKRLLECVASGRLNPQGQASLPLLPSPEGQPPWREEAGVLGSSSPSAAPAASFRALALTLSLSFHSVFEGLAVGLQETQAKVLQLAAAILLHKTVIAVSLALLLLQSRLPLRWLVASLATFVLMTPLGLGLGILVTHRASSQGSSSGSDTVRSALEGVAAGTFMYITFLEILPHELSATATAGSRLPRVLAVLLGFSGMTALRFLG
ncbi:hypothetical protein JD844_014778 [Phrynosoma platyrhinos]|uniref:Stereocilin LRR domain-containing protein n=1 Tax=Phrynosoma platyrhinos TaxID=52577 RepID=A0ABQ7SS60_PHRPL|nr:hypothetical protein JD844_014778 [Phrynosoma platyrhinos]